MRKKAVPRHGEQESGVMHVEREAGTVTDQSQESGVQGRVEKAVDVASGVLEVVHDVES